MSVNVLCERSVCGRLRRRRQRIDGSRLAAVAASVWVPLPSAAWRALWLLAQRPLTTRLGRASRPSAAGLAVLKRIAFLLASVPK